MLYRNSAHTACRLFGLEDHRQAPSVLCKRLATQDVAGAWDDIKRQSDVQLHATHQGQYMVRKSLVGKKKM